MYTIYVCSILCLYALIMFLIYVCTMLFQVFIALLKKGLGMWKVEAALSFADKFIAISGREKCTYRC